MIQRRAPPEALNHRDAMPSPHPWTLSAHLVKETLICIGGALFLELPLLLGQRENQVWQRGPISSCLAAQLCRSCLPSSSQG